MQHCFCMPACSMHGISSRMRLWQGFLLPCLCSCRSTRKAEKGRDERRKQLGLPEVVKLLPESDHDAQAASMVAFGSSASYVNNRYGSLFQSTRLKQ